MPNSIFKIFIDCSNYLFLFYKLWKIVSFQKFVDFTSYKVYEDKIFLKVFLYYLFYVYKICSDIPSIFILVIWVFSIFLVSLHIKLINFILWKELAFVSLFLYFLIRFNFIELCYPYIYYFYLLISLVFFWYIFSSL